MPVTVSTVTIYQNFFVLKKSIAECLLRQSYKNVTKIIKKTQNDELVYITVFNSRNDINQIIFQSYTLNDNSDRTLQKLVDKSKNLK